ncbi:YbhB/YbcL family Raf kinase inhibitor-like protein [Kitasatospora sp. NPDC086009]|uniref:YbhB/YbcL family Raf kinase inhibitor-like protein n=1 Tax=unclassified Kitasatospora TaxID=2633591 RepID=UPI0037C6D18D
MKRSTRVTALAATTAATVALAGAASTAAHSATQSDRFGHTEVRTGVPRHTPRFTVTSPDWRSGTVPAAGYANAFGCSGANQAPTVHWSGAPAGTRSYAVSLFDPDAPTGSGFWHAMTWDIPATVTTLTGATPAGAVAGPNDTGATGYLGPCPPAGDRAHHYVLRVVALDVPGLGLAATSTPAVASFSMAMSGHILATAELTATARR